MCADFFQILELVQAALMVNSHAFVLELTPLPELWVSIFFLRKPDAGSEGSKLEETVGIKFLLKLRQAIEHLCGSLRVSQVQDLFHTSELLDL